LHFFAVAVAAAAFLAATSYPFRALIFDNGVRLADGRAVFAEPGMLYAGAPISWLAAAAAEGGFTLRLVARSYDNDQGSPARIFTVARDIARQNLTVGQQGSSLVVRLRRDGATPQGLPAYSVARLFADREPHEIIVAVTRDAVQISVDGKRVVDDPQPRPPLEAWDPGYDAALGNDVTWIRPWLGEISAARFETASVGIDLLADGVLRAPAMHYSLNEIAFYSTNPIDAFLNFFAFVPLGALAFVALARPAVAKAALLWLIMSFTAESLQLFIENRHPSVMDLALNLAGALAGAALISRWQRGAEVNRR
jgi:hypothetical protein